MRIRETREIKAVFDLYLDGFSFKEIARMLNARDIPKLNRPIDGVCPEESLSDPEREPNSEGDKEGE